MVLMIFSVSKTVAARTGAQPLNLQTESTIFPTQSYSVANEHLGSLRWFTLNKSKSFPS